MSILKAIIRFFLFFTLSICLISTVSAQQSALMDTIYGADPLLFNGKVYAFVMPVGTEGHPFLFSDNYTVGDVMLHGKTYHDQMLKYDVFNQKLVLGFVDAMGAEKMIVVSDAFLEGFKLGAKTFNVPPESDSALAFVQLIGSRDFGIAYAWQKTLALDARVGSTNRVFSKAKHRSFIMSHGKLRAFKNKRTFLKLFTEKERPAMKKILKEYKIRLKHPDDAAMSALVDAWLKQLKP